MDYWSGQDEVGNATEHLVQSERGLPGLPAPEYADPDAILAYLRERQVQHATWEDWLALDAHETATGASAGRERIKVVDREDMLAAGRPA